MSRCNILKRVLLTVATLTGLASFYSCSVFAASTGSVPMTLSPSSGSYTVGSTITVNVYENSGSTGINTFEADLTYNSSVLQLNTDSSYTYINKSDFSFDAPEASTGNLICLGGGDMGGTVTGNVMLATIQFKAIAAGTASVSFLGQGNGCAAAGTGTALLTVINGNQTENLWNGTTSAGTFTITNPPTSTSGSKSSSSTSSSSTASKSSTSSSSTNSTPNKSSSSAASSTTTTLSSALPVNTLVSIKVVDSKGNPLDNVKVNLNSTISALTNSSGIASFIGVNPGNYTATINVNGQTSSQFIAVKGVTSYGVQQFELHAAAVTPNKDDLTAIITIIIILLIVAVGYFINRKRLNLTNDFTTRYDPDISNQINQSISAVDHEPLDSDKTDLINKIPSQPPLQGGTIIAPNDPVDLKKSINDNEGQYNG